MSKTTIPTGGITADAINGTLIADDAINSEHYTDASIDTAHVADSQITAAKTSGVGILEFDTWRISANQAIGSSGRQYVTDNWERTDTGPFEKIGTGLTQSSGVFSFPSTGKYLITFNPCYTNRGGGTNHNHVYFRGEISVTENNSSYNVRSQGNDSFDNATGGEFYGSQTLQMLLDVTDISNIKVKVGFYLANATTVLGDTNQNLTSINFMKLGDT
jgi:hypothetical protein